MYYAPDNSVLFIVLWLHKSLLCSIEWKGVSFLRVLLILVHMQENNENATSAAADYFNSIFYFIFFVSSIDWGVLHYFCF